jgi:hypothetical protein
MTTTDVISPDLKTILRRLKLSRILDTLPERLTLARQQKIPHQDLLLQVLSDEVARRDGLAMTLRVQKARLDPTMRLDAWDTSAKVTFDRALLNELTTLRFLDAHAHVTIVGPVGVGKPFSPTPSATSRVAAARRCLPAAPTRCSKRSSTPDTITLSTPSSANSSPSISSSSTTSRSTCSIRSRAAISTTCSLSAIAPDQ